MSNSPDSNDEPQAAPSHPASTRAGASASDSHRPRYASWLIIVYSALLMVIFCIIGFIPYSETFIASVQKTFQILGVGSDPAAAQPVTTSAPAAEANSTCVIIWVEHQQNDLGKKSRAKVWEQKVSDAVKASGMTPRQFYDLVVEHNPQLIADDYEFKKGKTYLLPACQ